MLETLKNTNKNLIYTTLSAGLFLLTIYMFSPFIGPYLISHGFTREQISLISSLAPLSIVIFSPIMGNLSDYLGRRTIQKFSLVMYLMALIFYLFVDHNFILLVLATILSTLFSEVYLQTTEERAQDNITDKRGKYTGIIESLKSFGGLLGSLIATFIVYRFQFSLVLKIVICSVIMLFVAGFLIRTGKSQKGEKKSLNPIKEIRNFTRIHELRDMTLLNFATSFHHPAVVLFIPLFITGELKGSLWFVGLYSMSNILGHMLHFVGGISCERFGIGKTAIRAIFVNAATFILLGFAHSPLVVVIISLVMGISTSFWETGSTCFVSEIGEKYHNEGTVIGSYSSIAYLSVFISFLLSGVIINYFGMRTLFIIYGLFAEVAAIYINFRLKNSPYYSSVK